MNMDLVMAMIMDMVMVIVIVIRLYAAVSCTFVASYTSVASMAFVFTDL
jgi:hypothetical protein